MPGLAWVESTFENLHPDEYFKSSDATHKYNCTAFAGGDVTKRWEPLHHWHLRAIRSSHFRALESQYYHEKQYVRCDNGEIEDGYEKIAIYADEWDDWQHAARLREDGWWESKIGNGEDICHRTLECLEGIEYGKVVQFLKRRVNGESECQTK